MFTQLTVCNHRVVVGGGKWIWTSGEKVSGSFKCPTSLGPG